MTLSARSRRRRALAAALLFAALPLAARAQDPRATAAHRAALDWLAQLDRGDAAASFAAASPLFKSAADEARWAKVLESERAPFGKVVARTLAGTQFHTEIPGLPEKGEYVLLLYRTSFAAKDGVNERVTVARDPDGVYRVAGYVIG